MFDDLFIIERLKYNRVFDALIIECLVLYFADALIINDLFFKRSMCCALFNRSQDDLMFKRSIVLCSTARTLYYIRRSNIELRMFYNGLGILECKKHYNKAYLL